MRKAIAAFAAAADPETIKCNRKAGKTGEEPVKGLQSATNADTAPAVLQACTEFLCEVRLRVAGVELPEIEHNAGICLETDSCYVCSRNGIGAGMIKKTTLQAGIVANGLQARLPIEIIFNLFPAF